MLFGRNYLVISYLLFFREKFIEWAEDFFPSAVGDVGVDLGGFGAGVSEEFLDVSEVGALF